MKKILKFFLEVSCLKSIQRQGWVMSGVKDPESVADHTFGVMFLAWTLGRKSDLGMRKLLVLSLLHELCEVYAGDLTPYHGILPKDLKKQEEMMKRWIRLPQSQKEKLSSRKYLLEKKAIERLLRPLPADLGKKIFAVWIEYEKVMTKEGRLVKQIDMLEALLQGFTYFGGSQEDKLVGFWEHVEEVVSIPEIKSFVRAFEDHHYHHKKTPFGATIRFLSSVGNLKTIPRISWLQRNIKEPTSLAEHTFMRTLMAWVFFEHTRPALNLEKILKLSLCMSLSSIELKGKTPSAYDPLLATARTQKEREKILSTWVRYSLKMKQRMFAKGYHKEKCAVEKLVEHLEPAIKKEILSLWDELKRNHTGEAHFVGQVHAVEALLQALQFYQKDPLFPIEIWWEWAFERCDTQFTFDFMDALKKEFYGKKKRVAAYEKRKISRRDRPAL